MSKVLLVGGAGYVGAVLAEELLERGYAVRVVDRLYFGDQALAAIRDRIDLVVADIRHLPDGVLDDVESVINVGGLSNDPTAEYNPRANHEMNVIAAVSLARRALGSGARRYLYASSCSIYDRGVDDEERDVLLDESSVVNPQAAYSRSKHEAEQALLPLASDRFAVCCLRKGTLFGFSPRMRYDLVVNTFVKDAMARGVITLHFGGEMWRPLADVRDAARAYITLLQADVATVNGQIFNLVYRNFRISELAMRTQAALAECGVRCEIRPEYTYRGVRNYRVSGRKLQRTLDFRPAVSVEDSVRTMVEAIRRNNLTDFDHPRYYNIRWMQLLEATERAVGVTGSVFGETERP